jgi:hypothetical protein
MALQKKPWAELPCDEKARGLSLADVRNGAGVSRMGRRQTLGTFGVPGCIHERFKICDLNAVQDIVDRDVREVRFFQLFRFL